MLPRVRPCSSTFTGLLFISQAASTNQYELPVLKRLLLSCSYLESWATTTLASSSGVFPLCQIRVWGSLQPVDAVRDSPAYQLPFQNNLCTFGQKQHSATIHSLFLQNNKNSLTNKDFFILSILTCIYSWRWNKRPVMSISSPLGSIPTLFLPLHHRQA